MLEKIGNPQFFSISKPDKSVLSYLRDILQQQANPVYYEIGVGIGGTTLPVAQLLDNRGTIVMFSREGDVLELAADLRNMGYANIDASWGSPSNTFSGYHFELARGFVEQKLLHFDLAFIDGGHVFHLDAPATCILKELCKPGALMIFDDWDWSLARSPTMRPSNRPKTAQEFDQRQIEACHVQLVCKALMDTDPRFEFLGLQDGSAVYRRRQS